MSTAHVVIVGSGIAGSLIAHALTRVGVQVTVFEKGPAFPYPHALQFREEIEQLFDNPKYQLPSDLRQVSTSGTYGKSVDRERGMVVGGSATHWGGVTPRMIPGDFRTDSLFGYGADWPVSYDDVEPYYVKAERLLGISGTTVDNPFAPPRSEAYPLPHFELSHGDQVLAEQLNEAGIIVHSTPQARTRQAYDDRPQCANFGTCHVCPIGVRYSPNHHLQKAVRSGHCTVHAETSVRRVLVDGAGRATGVLVQGNDERASREIDADVVVVAAGAIASARLLLLSTSSAHPDGLGNHSGQVGENLTFHHIWGGGLRFKEKLFTGRVGPSTARSFQFLNPETRGDHGGINIGLDDTVDVRWLTQRFNLWNVRDADKIVDRMRLMPHQRSIMFHSESIPGDGKRVELSNQTDRFGDPFPHVHYESNQFDYDTFRYAEHLFERIRSAVKPENAWFTSDPESFDSGAHHMGTCRMATVPSEGVVDAQGKVFEAEDVYVAGASTFVGGSGAVHPTLTLAALSLRTADFLKERLA